MGQLDPTQPATRLTRNPIDPFKNNPFWPVTCFDQRPDWPDPNPTRPAHFAMSVLYASSTHIYMMSKIIILLFHIPLYSDLKTSNAQTWVKAGYWFSDIKFPISDINSALFTHLIWAFADVNSSSYELSVSSTDVQYFSTFTKTVRQKNPSVTTLLSIAGGNANHTTLAYMVSKETYRTSFIDSSIKIASLYGFQGLDLCWVSAHTLLNMKNMGLLFQE